MIKIKLSVIGLVITAAALNGCAVVAVTAAVVGTTVSVATAVVGTTVAVGSAAVGTTVDLAKAGVRAATNSTDPAK